MGRRVIWVLAGSLGRDGARGDPRLQWSLRMDGKRENCRAGMVPGNEWDRKGTGDLRPWGNARAGILEQGCLSRDVEQACQAGMWQWPEAGDRQESSC